ncbi:GHKL domain-containing protein [Loigolactobacillus jiayinensis]|uniref:GHKL domain-containing protein n=1 Tax=Loigolactobacillus jiayinensis TaxID=2486016 RepID=A0ABW1RAW1_9LACO
MAFYICTTIVGKTNKDLLTEIIFVIVSGLEYFITTIIDIPNLLNGLLSFFITLISLNILKINFRKITIAAATYIFISALSELFSTLILGNSIDHLSYSSQNNLIILTSFLFQSSFLVIIAIIKNIRIKEISFYWYIIFPIPILSCILLTFIKNEINQNKLVLLSLIIVIIINQFSFMIIYSFQLFIERNLELDSKNKRSSLMISNYSSRLESYEQQRKLIHDFRKYLVTLLTLLENHKYTDAKDLIRELLPNQQEKINNYMQQTGNIIIDAQINNFKLALDNKITFVSFNFDVDPLTKIITDKDISLIVGNILDNILFHADISDGKSAYINFIYNDSIFYFKIINTVKTEKLLNKTKHHGLGTSIVKETVAKYGGNVIIDKKGDNYSITIIINF